jgi:hypothetical protein
MKSFIRTLATLAIFSVALTSCGLYPEVSPDVDVAEQYAVTSSSSEISPELTPLDENECVSAETEDASVASTEVEQPAETSEEASQKELQEVETSSESMTQETSKVQGTQKAESQKSESHAYSEKTEVIGIDKETTDDSEVASIPEEPEEPEKSVVSEEDVLPEETVVSEESNSSEENTLPEEEEVVSSKKKIDYIYGDNQVRIPVNDTCVIVLVPPAEEDSLDETFIYEYNPQNDELSSIFVGGLSSYKVENDKVVFYYRIGTYWAKTNKFPYPASDSVSFRPETENLSF